MHCIQCHSQKTQRLSMVHESGTVNVITKSKSTNGHYRTTTGTHQTNLAIQAAPPKKKSWGVGLIFLELGILVGYFAKKGIGLSGYVWAAVLIGLGIFLIRMRIRRNQTVWEPAYKVWSESWLCLKCGHTFHQPNL